MEIIFSAILSQIKIDEKGGGYLLTLSVPETDKEEMAKVLTSPARVFQCVLLSAGEKKEEVEPEEQDH